MAEMNINIKERIEKVNDQLRTLPPMQMFEEKTKLPPGVLVLALLLVTVLMVAFNVLGCQELLTSIICVAYPTFRSIQAL